MDIINIKSIGPPPRLNTAKTAESQDGPEKGAFGRWLNQSLGEVVSLQQNADSASQKFISGESKDIHGTMIAMQKASIAFNLVVEVRNKVIAAYEEVKRMQF